ncbi:MAG TPA: nucleotidyl transferase AbiEii/AbiGii toxin family protein [Patescibacteria group bacterium]|nr:nucleotidyl transferase AbiEii/AbiGii toxin family protein [Patescibacteria group bacterium]
MSKIYLGLLDSARQKVFHQLRMFEQDGYLAGGTALALQLNHRKSVDFDVFVKKPIGSSLRRKIKTIFGDQPYEVNTTDQITFPLSVGIEITFLYYWYPHIRPLVSTTSLSLASVDDIIADKAHTLGRRALWRDYVDLFVVMKQHDMNIDHIITLASQKFEGEFVKEQFLEQISYFDDIAVVPVEFIARSYTPEEIKTFLTTQVEEYATTIRSKK